MAARRQAYQQYAACMQRSHEARKSLLSYRASWEPKQPHACEELAGGACGRCICCEHCPCDLTLSYISTLIPLAAIGVAALAMLGRRLSRGSSHLESSSLPSPPPLPPSTAHPPADISVLAPLSPEQQLAARQALHLWLEARLISPSLFSQLSATTYLGRQTSSRHRLALALALLAVLIGLLESLSSNTLLAHVLAPFFHLYDVPAMGKAACLLILSLASLAAKTYSPLGRAQQEDLCSALLLCYLGALTLGLVDTGWHAGETATGRRGVTGSRLWYRSVGSLGAASFASLGLAAPRAFEKAALWASASLCLMGGSWLLLDDTRALLGVQLGGAAFVGYGRFLSREEWVWWGVCCVLCGAGLYDISHLPVFDTDCALSYSHASVGCFLGIHSSFLLAVAIKRNHQLLASVGSSGLIIACTLALWTRHHCTPHYAGLGFAVTLPLALGCATAALGGWGLRPLLRLPPHAFEGVTGSLVLATLLALLVLLLVGNSDSSEEWVEIMDLRKTEPRLVDGRYRYHMRAMLLPWSVPIFVYYRLLCRFWPTQEAKVRWFPFVKVAVLLWVGSHCIRLLSWSSLLLFLAALTVALPRIDDLICGRAR